MPRLLACLAFAVLILSVPAAWALPIAPGSASFDELAAPGPSPAAAKPATDSTAAPADEPDSPAGRSPRVPAGWLSGVAGLGALTLGLYGAALRWRRDHHV
jgi:hypothetical protein